MSNHYKNDFTDTQKFKSPKKYSFVFVCQKGRLEAESIILATSIKNFVRCNHEMIAVVPGPEEVFGNPRKETIDILKNLGVRVVRIRNELINKETLKEVPNHYLLANKICGLFAPVTGDKIILLDSDTIISDDFSSEIRFSLPFNGRRLGQDGNLPAIGSWEQLFKIADTKIPLIRFQYNQRTKDQPLYSYSPPYFNSGFIGINSNNAKELGKIWRKIILLVEKTNLVKDPYFIEQISLTLAVHKLDIIYDLKDQPNITHYFHPCEIKKNNTLLKIVKSCIKSEKKIGNFLKNFKEWDFLS